MAYGVAKAFTAHSRSSSKPPVTERLWAYLQCAGVVAFIALLASGNFNGDGDDREFVSIDYNRGMIVFVTLFIAALVGATEGYTTSDKYPPSRDSGDDF